MRAEGLTSADVERITTLSRHFLNGHGDLGHMFKKPKLFLKGHVHIAVVNARALICFDGWAWLCIVFLLSRLKRQ